MQEPEPSIRPKIKITFKRPPLPESLSSNFASIPTSTYASKTLPESSTFATKKRTSSLGKSSQVKKKKTSSCSQYSNAGTCSRTGKKIVAELSEDERSHTQPTTTVSFHTTLDEAGGKESLRGMAAVANYKCKFQWRQVAVKIPLAMSSSMMQSFVWKRFPVV